MALIRVREGLILKKRFVGYHQHTTLRRKDIIAENTNRSWAADGVGVYRSEQIQTG